MGPSAKKLCRCEHADARLLEKWSGEVADEQLDL
jgi:hypothetical protein